MTKSAETATPLDCEACGRSLVDEWSVHHPCARAIKYVAAIITTEPAQDLCELQDGNVTALRRMLLDAFLTGEGAMPDLAANAEAAVQREDQERDFLSPEDRKILNFMFANSNMSPREVAAHFNVPMERVVSILTRDLNEVIRNS